jgi:hypothetical protein
MKNRERIGKLNNDNDQTGRNTIQLNGQCVHARGKTIFSRVSFIIMTQCLRQR